MKGLVCKTCGFIALEDKAPEKCPVCGSPASMFEEKEDALKTAKDAANKTELEKKHIPVIRVVEKCNLIEGGCVDVSVKLGEITHPMQADHHIVHVDFYIDRKFTSRVMLTPERMNPAVLLHFKPGEGKLTVVSLCNLHGAWIAEAGL